MPVDPVELLRVQTAVAIRVMAVREALVAGITPHPVDLTGEPLILKFECALEALPLEASRVLVLVRGERTLDRVAEHQHQLHLWQIARHPLDREGMVDVVSAGLEGERCAAASGPVPRDLSDGEVAAIPVRPTLVVQVEVVDSLVERGLHHLWVRHQGPVQRGGAAPLGPDHDEVGLQAKRRRRRANQHSYVAACPLERSGGRLSQGCHVASSWWVSRARSMVTSPIAAAGGCQTPPPRARPRVRGVRGQTKRPPAT